MDDTITPGDTNLSDATGWKVSLSRVMCVSVFEAKAQILGGLHDQVVPYKSTLTLSCEVIGIPLPFRSWLKNGRPVCCDSTFRL